MRRYAVKSDGTLGSFTVFTEGVGIGDGEKTDMAGNVFSTGGAGPGIIRITSPEGRLLGTINLPIFGGEPKKMITEELGLPTGSTSFEPFGGLVIIEHLDVAAVVMAIVLVTGLAVFFNKTRIGRALRAVADDHQAALSVGISLNQIWAIVWFAAGIVALATGIMWGAKSDVSFALQIVALKALPVLIIGGFTSIPGAIIGGLIIGFGEKLFEIYWGGLLGSGVEGWFAYVIALIFLLFRPQGLFGEKIIERI
jgi:branched-chain amino acid transport system permease protein